ncbi:hypothetical protein RJ639_007430 [Escallonia herrerae]|uniref:Uncharacterized protein n=1 Tax=Escallonia herrerae TaxID=1293975 RepID=A0AA88VWL2_9ASTE|nr:hypothetical protein RJ639_007430 [Escallonia herrerae]
MSLRHMSRVCLRAVQGLKDQNSKGIIKPSQPKPRSESEKSGHGRRVSGIVEPAKKVNVDDEKRRMRVAEKEDNVLQLIFWGPK